MNGWTDECWHSQLLSKSLSTLLLALNKGSDLREEGVWSGETREPSRQVFAICCSAVKS